MEKGERFGTGVLLIIFSFILIYSYLTTFALVLAIMSMVFGTAGTAFLYLSQKIDRETVILSATIIILGGLIVPLLNFKKDTLIVVVTICYIAAILLFVLKPPERKNVEAAVQQ